MTHVDTGELAEHLASATPALDSANRVSCVSSLRAAVLRPVWCIVSSTSSPASTGTARGAALGCEEWRWKARRTG